MIPIFTKLSKKKCVPRGLNIGEKILDRKMLDLYFSSSCFSFRTKTCRHDSKNFKYFDEANESTWFFSSSIDREYATLDLIFSGVFSENYFGVFVRWIRSNDLFFFLECTYACWDCLLLYALCEPVLLIVASSSSSALSLSSQILYLPIYYLDCTPDPFLKLYLFLTPDGYDDNDQLLDARDVFLNNQFNNSN